MMKKVVKRVKTSRWYQVCKKNYELGLWSIDRLKQAVDAGRITEEEYKEITGEDYEESIDG